MASVSALIVPGSEAMPAAASRRCRVPSIDHKGSWTLLWGWCSKPMGGAEARQKAAQALVLHLRSKDLGRRASRGDDAVGHEHDPARSIAGKADLVGDD